MSANLRRVVWLVLALGVWTAASCGGPTAPSTTKPQVSAVSPPNGAQGTTVGVTLTGANFAIGDTAAVVITGSGVTVGNVSVQSPTTAAATLTIAGNAPLGPRTLTLTTATGGTSPAMTFTVVPPAPTLTAIGPTSAVAGTTATLTLTGTNFIGNATTVAVSGGGVTVGQVTVAKSTSLTVPLTIDAGAATGNRDVTVKTAGGTSAARTLTITAPPPASITAFTASPPAIASGQSSTLSWSGIANATGCSIDNGVGTIACSDGSTSVGPAATTTYTLTATSPGGNATATATVTVSAPAPAPGPGPSPPPAPSPAPGPAPAPAPVAAPTLGSVAPGSGDPGRQVDVTLTGSNFVAGNTAVSVSGGGVSVSRVVVASSTLLTARFDIKKNARSGNRNVVVTTPGGTSNAVTFTVTGPHHEQASSTSGPGTHALARDGW